MVLNAAVQMLREADELKQTILRFKSGTSMLQDRNLWNSQQQLQKVYQKILILDLDYALEKKVEQDLWNVGFKQQIEALQAISKDRKSPLRADAQAMLSWVLQAAAGFYLCLLHQICTTFKLDLPFRRRASLLGAVEGWEASGGGAGAAGGAATGAAGAARYASQHCLVHLGDLARYRQQLRLAHTFYKHALAVSPHSGQPYNQLALVWWRRGRRLCAVYWHVRSLLVRAPFPPAPANLARTLAAAVAAPSDHGDKDSPLPVLPGVSPGAAPRAPAERIDAHSYCNELLRALHYIHSADQLEKATALVENLNWSLTPLIATDSFDSMTLIKMTCVLMWAVQSSADEYALAAGALTGDELAAARLAEQLAAACVLALLLPAYAGDEPPRRALPALKVWLQWLGTGGALCRSGAWRARPQLWGALAHALTALAPAARSAPAAYETVPLPEDEELQGFLPLEEGFKGLRFAGRARWDAYSVPELEPSDDDSGPPADPWGAASEPDLEHRVRALRLQRLAARLAEQHPDHLTCTTAEDGSMSFEASALSSEQLSQALAELSARDSPPTPPGPAAPASPSTAAGPPPPPVVISEADFREKVREKRVGILKPQGSLERAREERAQHGAVPAQQEAEASDDSGKGEAPREARKPRVNIAMAAIMRKQEETNKQVKFVTPPPTPDSSADPTEAPSSSVAAPKGETEKPKMIQPKPMKSLANLPVGRKTGGILSLKDKSGYPHLVNVEPETKKTDKEEKVDSKSTHSGQSSQQSYQKRQDSAPAWNGTGSQVYSDPARMGYQKGYGMQPGLGYSASPASPPGQFIKLPVVNPKEIDVRTAALQKQNSRQDLFQETNKFAQGYQPMDKMNFLNDLPPRFANQYRYWHAAQDGHFENKFRDETPKPPAYTAPPPSPWWKPDNPPMFNPSYSVPVNVPNYYSVPSNVPGPYQGVQYNQLPQSTQQNMGQNKSDGLSGSFLQPAVGQPQLQGLQGLVTSPAFASAPGSFGYSPAVPYDSAMFPQFGNKLGYPPLQMKMMDKPAFQPDANMDMGINFGANLLDTQQRGVNFGEPFKQMAGAATTSDQVGASGVGAGTGGGAEAGSYSLFSAQQGWPAARSATQSLWSGSQSPLERLLEQQKQKKPQ